MQGRIHAKLAVKKGAEAYKLWLFARFHDSQGSGKVVASIDSVSSFFGVSVRTIFRWMRDERFFHPYCCNKNGYLTIYMRSLPYSTKAWDLDSWGVVAVCELEALKNLETVAAEITIQREQSKSKYAVRKQKKGQSKWLRFLDPCGAFYTEEELKEIADLNQLASELGYQPFQEYEEVIRNTRLEVKPSYKARGVSFISMKGVFMYENYFTPYGTSQINVAQELGIAERHLRRLLSNTKKLQQWYHRPEYNEQLLRAKYSDESDQLLYKFKDKVYRKHTLLYDVNYRLCSMKTARNKFNQLLRIA